MKSVEMVTNKGKCMAKVRNLGGENWIFQKDEIPQKISPWKCKKIKEDIRIYLTQILVPTQGSPIS